MENIAEGNTRLKVQPPIRNKTNCNLLWDLLKMEQIDVLASQHCAISPFYKFLDVGSFKKAVNGIPSLGFSLQSLWTKLRSPALSSNNSFLHYLIRLSKWLSATPARLLNLDRGLISAGKIADFVVWEPEAAIMGKSWGKSPEICPYEGEEMHGKVRLVIVRGEKAFEDGEFFAVGRRERRSR